MLTPSSTLPTRIAAESRTYEDPHPRCGGEDVWFQPRRDLRRDELREVGRVRVLFRGDLPILAEADDARPPTSILVEAPDGCLEDYGLLGGP